MSASKGGSTKLGRRHLIVGGAAAGIGALAAAGIQATATPGGTEKSAATHSKAAVDGANGAKTVPFHGVRQAGVDTPAQSHGVFIALDLKAGVDRAQLKSLLKLLSDDAANLTQGRGALADTEPEMAHRPASLTVTFGLGPHALGLASPALAIGEGSAPWLTALPSFSIDRLQPEYCDGDVLLQFCADDPLTLAHAQRMLLKDARTFARVRWVQTGYRRAYGTEPSGTTMRNLFGQVDGTANPAPSSPQNESVVWGVDGFAPWTMGGTTVVIRRIAMNLDGWDELDRGGRDQSVGRRISNGSPLTGTLEHDEPDFAAKNPLGFPVIADFAHMRRARSEDPREQIFRRAYNYELPPKGEAVSDAGLIFVSYQSNIMTQYVPLQARLSELDLLNQWTVPIGSATFAILPGCQPGSFVGESLFS